MTASKGCLDPRLSTEYSALLERALLFVDSIYNLQYAISKIGAESLEDILVSNSLQICSRSSDFIS